VDTPKVLEDLGWYVADNLPPELIAQIANWGWRRVRASPVEVVMGRELERLHR